jgi:hypothetical protein
VQERRLPAPGRSAHRDVVAAPNLQRHVADRRDRTRRHAEDAADRLGLNDGVVHTSRFYVRGSCSRSVRRSQFTGRCSEFAVLGWPRTARPNRTSNLNTNGEERTEKCERQFSVRVLFMFTQRPDREASRQSADERRCASGRERRSARSPRAARDAAPAPTVGRRRSEARSGYQACA